MRPPLEQPGRLHAGGRLHDRGGRQVEALGQLAGGEAVVFPEHLEDEVLAHAHAVPAHGLVGGHPGQLGRPGPEREELAHPASVADRPGAHPWSTGRAEGLPVGPGESRAGILDAMPPLVPAPQRRFNVPIPLRDGVTWPPTSSSRAAARAGGGDADAVRQRWRGSVPARPTEFAAGGYVVVSADVRGRGDSEGEFVPYRNDGPDGGDVIAWARRPGVVHRGGRDASAAATRAGSSG